MIAKDPMHDQGIDNRSAFGFFDPGPLRDRELSVVLVATHPGDPAKSWIPNYDFALHVDGHADRVGKINLRAGNTRDIEMYGGHFAYGVEPQWRGRHYAERGVRLLLPLAAQHGLTTIWITCNPDNYPSRRTCERLGAELVEIVPLPPENDQYIEGEREKCRYRIRLDAADGTPSAL